MDAPVSSNMRLFIILARAGCWSKDYPDRGVKWLKHAVQLIIPGLPSTMVPPYRCSIIYNTMAITSLGSVPLNQDEKTPTFQIQVVEAHIATLMSNEITIGNIPLWFY